MSLVELAELDGVTISTTEISILSGTSSLQTSTTNGVYHLWLDPVGAALAKGDKFKVCVYEKVEATGGTKRRVFCASIEHAQSELWMLPPLMLKNGWDMTITKLAGTDRAWDASVRGNQLTISEPFELDNVTVGASELSVLSGTTALQTNTTAGVYQLFVDPLVAPMAKGDDFAIRVYEKVEGTGGTKRVIWSARIMDGQMENFVSPMFHLRNGWDMTIQKIAGTDRLFDASVRKVG